MNTLHHSIKFLGYKTLVDAHERNWKLSYCTAAANIGVDCPEEMIEVKCDQSSGNKTGVEFREYVQLLNFSKLNWELFSYSV